MAEIDDMLAEQEAIHGERAKSVCDLFRDQAVRWQLITLFLIVSCMQFIGINVVCVLLFSAFSIAYSFLEKVSSATSSKLLTATVAVRRGSVVDVYYNLFPWMFGTWDELGNVFQKGISIEHPGTIRECKRIK